MTRNAAFWLACLAAGIAGQPILAGSGPLLGADVVGRFAVNGLTGGVALQLRQGMNLVAFPVELDAGLTSHTLDDLLGSGLESVARMNPSAQRFEETRFAAGVPAGPEFPIRPGEGYLVRMAHDALVDGLPAVTTPAGLVDVGTGVNLVGFVPVAHRMSAHRLLALLPGLSPRASLTRFDPRRARFQTATRQGDAYYGVDFRLSPREGYLLSSAQSAASFDLPPLVFVRAGQTHGIVADSLAAGGGSSSSTGYQLFSTIGQPVPPGVQDSPSYRLHGGFLGACCADLPPP